MKIGQIITNTLIKNNKMIPESLRNIATQIEDAAKVRANNQEAILAFCKDKSFDLIKGNRTQFKLYRK